MCIADADLPVVPKLQDQFAIIEDANLVTIHARHVTLQPRNIQIVRRLRGEVLDSQEASGA